MLWILTFALIFIPPIVFAYFIGSLWWALLLVPVYYFVRGIILSSLMHKAPHLFIPIQLTIDVVANVIASLLFILADIGFGFPAAIWTVIVLYFWLARERE